MPRSREKGKKEEEREVGQSDPRRHLQQTSRRVSERERERKEGGGANRPDLTLFHSCQPGIFNAPN